MSPRVAVAVVGIAAVSAGPGNAGAQTAALQLVWFDPCDRVLRGEPIAREEAASLLARMGASVAWRRARPGELRRSDEVWVVLVGEGPQPASGSVILGATLKHQPVAPIVWIRVPNVRAAVGISRATPDLLLAPGELRLLSVALGRVIAHEVVHALVPSLAHGSGLMASRFTPQQLAAASMPIAPDVILAFQAALRGEPAFVPPGTRVLAAEAGAPDEDR